VEDARSRSGFNLAAPNSQVRIDNSDLGVGRFADNWNRIVFPGETVFRKCRFILRPELTEKKDAPQKWAALHVFWNIDKTIYGNQTLTFDECEFGIAPEVGSDYETFVVWVEPDESSRGNQLTFCKCKFSDRYRSLLEAKAGGAFRIRNE
jgi:hypothetical protein